MNLSNHDLSQIDEPYVRSLSPAQQLELCLKILSDLKKARDRLNQTPNNSSVPSGSMAPWTSGVKKPYADEDDDAEEETMFKDALKALKDSADNEDDADKEESSKNAKKSLKKSGDSSNFDGAVENNPVSSSKQNQRKKSEAGKRNAGKQPGAEGHGRTVDLALTGPDELHRASHCAGCSNELPQDALFHATTGLYVVDLIVVGVLGLKLTHTKHLYGDTECICGHMTRTEPGRCELEPEWNVALTKWHLVGPMLESFIVCMAMRMRLSRRRIQEFLNDWMGLWLGIGTINQCIHEAGRAAEPLEKQFIAEIQSSGLLGADETPWKEGKKKLYLWAFSTATVALFMIGSRGAEVIERILGKNFLGWLMSDGWKVYRSFINRLRCWAHLIRKARGLSESVDGEAREFGKRALAVLEMLMKAVYEARENPKSGSDLRRQHTFCLGQFRLFCLDHWDSKHDKVRALAREFIYDWDAIWVVLSKGLSQNNRYKLVRILSYGVVPLSVKLISFNRQGCHLFWSHLLACRINFMVHFGMNRKACGCSSGRNQINDHFMTCQRFASPVLANK